MFVSLDIGPNESGDLLVVILDRGQQPHLLRFGIKPAAELVQEIEAYLA